LEKAMMKLGYVFVYRIILVYVYEPVPIKIQLWDNGIKSEKVHGNHGDPQKHFRDKTSFIRTHTLTNY